MATLTFVVTTKNQHDELFLLLKTISAETNEKTDIIIIDESDEIWEFSDLSTFNFNCNVQYIFRPATSLDQSLIDGSRLATGDFVWWFGDDFILPGALTEVLKNIEEIQNLSFLWLNSAQKESNESHTFNLPKSLTVNNPNFIFDFPVGQLAFISSTVFRRYELSHYLNEAEKHEGSALVCLFLALSVIANGQNFHVDRGLFFLSSPKPPGKKRWYDPIKVWGVEYPKLLLLFEQDFDKGKIRQAIKKNMVLVLKAIISERAKGYEQGFASRNTSVLKLITVYKWTLGFWFYFPFLLINHMVLRVLFRVYVKILQFFNG